MHQHLLMSHETHQTGTSKSSIQPLAKSSQQLGLHPPPSILHFFPCCLHQAKELMSIPNGQSMT